MIFLVLKSRSASAIAIVPAGMFIAWFLLTLRPLTKAVLAVYFVIGGCVVWPGVTMILSWLGRDLTLTGRTEIWATAFDSVIQSPTIGYGYLSPTYGDFAYILQHLIGVHDPHNGFIDTALSLGIIGVVLLVFVIISFWRVLGSVYRLGGEYRASALVFGAPAAGWLFANITEANTRPFVAVASFGFGVLSLILAQPRSRLVRRDAEGRSKVQVKTMKQQPGSGEGLA
jgi:O-antigen ligase